MLVNQTKMDLETNLKASMQMTKQLKLIVLCCFCPACVVLGVLFLVLDPSDLLAPIFMFVIAALFVIFYLCFFKPIVKRTIKKTLEGKEGYNTFIFEDDGFTIQTHTNAGMDGTSTGVYSSLSKAEEYGDMWLLYYNRATVFIVMKSGMVQGTAEELAVFLGVKLGERYQNKMKKRGK